MHMDLRWLSVGLLLPLLLEAAVATSLDTTTPVPDSAETGPSTTLGADDTEQPPLPPPPPAATNKQLRAHRKAQVVVIDTTKNTSSVVSIELPPQPDDGNLTVDAMRQLQIARSLHCLAQHRANIFLLVHLNRNWRQKLHFVRHLLQRAHEQLSSQVVVVLFNEFTDIFATFGTNPLTSEAEVLAALAGIQAAMERDESAAVSAHWPIFHLDDALNAGFRYARRFLRQFSLDARPSVLFSYFDDGAIIDAASVASAEAAMRQFASSNPFAASVSLLQWPSQLPVPALWARVAELLSSSPSYQATASTEDELLGLTAQLVTDICQKIRPV